MCFIVKSVLALALSACDQLKTGQLYRTTDRQFVEMALRKVQWNIWPFNRFYNCKRQALKIGGQDFDDCETGFKLQYKVVDPCQQRPSTTSLR